MQMGPRVIKTGLAITLALYLCIFIGLEPAMIAGLAAVGSVQPSIYRTWRQAWDQFQANTLGAAIALGAVYAIGSSPLVIGLAAIISILICLRLRMESTIPFMLVTILVIMDAPQGDWVFALKRFAIILIGTSVALLVNVALWPPNHNKMFLQRIQSVFQHISLLLRTSISNEMTESAAREQKERLAKELERLDDFYHLFDEERRKFSRVKAMDRRLHVVYKQMVQSLHKGAEVVEVVEEYFFQSNQLEPIGELYDKQLEALTKYHELLLLKFEGKIKPSEADEAAVLQQHTEFMNQVIALHDGHLDKMRLVMIGASIFEYGLQLTRLERLIDLYNTKEKQLNL